MAGPDRYPFAPLTITGVLDQLDHWASETTDAAFFYGNDLYMYGAESGQFKDASIRVEHDEDVLAELEHRIAADAQHGVPPHPPM